MNGIVVYKSKTGFSKKYAEWIGEELGFDVKSLNETGAEALAGKDLIIYGGGVYAGMIGGFNKMKTLIPEGAKLVLFACGASPAEAAEVDRMWSGSLSENELVSVPHFYMQSGICYEKMGFFDRTLLRIFTAMLKRSKNKSNVDEGVNQTLSASHDYSSREFIMPLVEYVRELDKILQ